jgi:type II secretory pathway pseudopilin PulG
MTARTAGVMRRRARRGFSLVELTIVIGVIIILVALVLAVTTAVLAKNEERTTRATLAILDAAIKEWERQVDRRVTVPFSLAEGNTGNWDVPWDPNLQSIQPAPALPEGQLPAIYRITSGAEPNFLEFQRTIWLLELIAQQPTVRDVITKIPEDSFRRIRVPQGSNFIYFTLKEVVDGWGTPILAVFPGRDWTSADPVALRDTDGTIRTALEQSLGVSCRNRQVMFVSAGPDQRFNDVPATGDVDERADNIYSYGQEGQ